MRKPKVLKVYDFHDCCAFVKARMGKELCGEEIDFADWLNEEIGGISNGSVIYLPDAEDNEDAEDWVKEILKVFEEEFGDKARYLFSW